MNRVATTTDSLWHRFWFSERPASTIALFRMLYGALVMFWAAALLPYSLDFLSDDGIYPDHPGGRFFRTGVLDFLTSDVAAVMVPVALLVCGLLIFVGCFTRIASIVNFVLLLSVARRNPEIVNSGDSLLRHFGFFLMFAPAGAALSVDKWRKDRDDFWSIPWHAPWAQRLIQLQVSFVYFFSTYAKLRGEDWRGGGALSEVWRAGDLVRFDVPLFIHDSVLASEIASWSTIVIEGALALLIWNRRARPYVIVAGLLLHAGIELSMAVGFFSLVVCSGYLLFLPEERGVQVIGWIRERAARLPSPARRRAAAAPQHR